MVVLTQTKLYQISELNRLVKKCLQYEFGQVDVVGEISNYSKASSGHAYFSLKDAHAQVTCALFSSRASINLENGMMVKARASVGLYEQRGQYQLIIQQIEPYGEGQLRRAYEALKSKLQAEGLFDPAHKKPLPIMPITIGIITSVKAAALADVEKVLHDRFPMAQRILYPAQVQGIGAEVSIRTALKQAIGHGLSDVILMVRGGGSLEDLWAFNDEQLARDIHACPLPIITGVGHEIDTTIVDFVSDHAAPTPSAAAIAATPDQLTLTRQVAQSKMRIQRYLLQYWQQSSWRLDQLRQRALSPEKVIERQRDLLKQQTKQLQQQLFYQLMRRKHTLQLYQQTLRRLTPSTITKQALTSIAHIKQQLQYLCHNAISQRTSSLAQLRKSIELLSPKSILKKGYAMITDAEGKLLTQPQKTHTGQTIQIEWTHAKAHATITDVDIEDA